MSTPITTFLAILLGVMLAPVLYVAIASAVSKKFAEKSRKFVEDFEREKYARKKPKPPVFRSKPWHYYGD